MPARTTATFAGTALVEGAGDGIGAAARFSQPYGIATDGTNLFVADTENHTIRQIIISTGTVSTLAGLAGTAGFLDGNNATATFHEPMGIATDGTYLYVADTGNNAIRKVDNATGQVTTLVAAGLFHPTGIALQGGMLYVADMFNNVIRSVDPVTGATTLYAGSGAGSADGNRLTTATFDRPAGMASDGINLYVTDNWNYTIRMIGPDDMVRTIVGQVGVSPATPTLLPFQPTGLALATVPTGTTYLYSTDYANNTVNQIDTVTGAMTILAGRPGLPGYLDGIGPGAVLNRPLGLCSDNAYLYLADQDTHTIRRINIATGEVLTVASSTASAGTRAHERPCARATGCASPLLMAPRSRSSQLPQPSPRHEQH